MIKFEIKPEYYKQIHNAINAVYDECLLNFTENKLKTILIDPSNVLMGSIEIDKTVFESYEVDEKTTVGYMLNNLGGFNEFEMFINSKTNHKFNFYQDGDKSKVDITHDIFLEKITLPDVKNLRRQLKMANLDLPCAFDMPVSMFKKIVKRDKYFQLVIENNHLICNGDPYDMKWHTIPMCINPTEDATAIYSIEFIQDIVKAIPNDIDTIKISMDSDYPCTIEFNICDGKVPVKYLLAPRIISE